jgi:hypothetical protein
MTRDEARLQLRCKASSFRTICEVHREIYDATEGLAEPSQSQIRELVIDAFIMGKKMDGKLKEYKADWDRGEYELNNDRADDRARRLSGRE